MSAKILFVFCLVLLLVSGFNSAGYSQEKEYPNKPIEIIVPNTPGGGVDLFFRLLSDELIKTMKVPLPIINQPAAGGLVAASQVANAKKDGYTMFGALLGKVTSMIVADPPFNVVRDFDPVLVHYGYASTVLVTRSDTNFKSFEDVIDYAKKKPGDLIVGTSTAGTNLFLDAKLINREAKVDITILPFTGSPEIITNLLGGHISLGMVSDIAAMPYVKAGKIRVLAADIKSQLFPDVLTFVEKGYARIDLISSIVLLGPKGLPPAIIKTWENALQGIIKDPRFLASVKKLGYNTDFRTRNLENLLKEDLEKYSRFTREELGWK